MSRGRARYIFFFEITIWVIIIVAAIVGTLIANARAQSAPVTETSAPAQVARAETAAEPAPPEPKGYWTGPINGAVPATLRGATVLKTDELTALLEGEKVVLIDASNAPLRPEKLAPNAPWMPAPHPIIPESLWIAGSGMGEITPEVDAMYRAHLAKATADNLDMPIVVYCHERCWLSYNAAKRALSYGYRKVYWYPGGIEGWRAAKLPTSIAVAIEH
jgi:PQQ-dependent catabolism-associated CXXCW motif protein